MNPNALQNVVTIEHAGRIFGMPSQTLAERTRHAPPDEIGMVFLEDIVQRSSINALAPQSTLSVIVAAYESDINALNQRRQEADTFMLDVLVCGMEKMHVDDTQHPHEIEMLQQLLRPLGISAQIPLTAEKCALPSEELVSWLKNQFRTEVDRIARRIAATMQYLADYHVIGLIEWTKSDVCKYHYFSWMVTDEKKEVGTERVGNINTWHKIVTTIEVKATLMRTRHTHHLVNAAWHILDGYKSALPPRVERLLTKVPVWLKPELLVLDGTQVLEESVTSVGHSEARTEVISVAKYDPAIGFGNFALVGWTADEIPAKTEVTPATEVRKEDALLAFITKFFICALLVSSIIVGLFAFNRHATKVLEWQYGEYLSADSMRRIHGVLANQGELFVVQTEERLKLPGVDHAVTFKGRALGNSVMLATPHREAMNVIGEDLVRIPAPKYVGKIVYGDIDLRSLFDLPFILHTHSVTDKEIRYTAEKLQR